LVLKKLKERQTVKGLRKDNPVRKLVDAVCHLCDLSVEKVAGTLCKTILNSYGEPIDGINQRVVTAVGECPTAGELKYSQNVKIAQELINKTLDASSKKMDGATVELYAAGSKFSDVLDAHVLAGKRITKTDVETIIQTQSVISEPLELAELMPMENLPVHLTVMIQKLDKGSLQSARIDQMSDLVKSFQYLFMKWVRKYGAEQTEVRYMDLLAKVNFDCTEAQVETENPDEPYAPKMYEILISRLQARVADAHDELHGCTAEHLLGAAGVLTEQCKAWWSDKFEVEERP